MNFAQTWSESAADRKLEDSVAQPHVSRGEVNERILEMQSSGRESIDMICLMMMMMILNIKRDEMIST